MFMLMVNVCNRLWLGLGELILIILSKSFFQFWDVLWNYWPCFSIKFLFRLHIGDWRFKSGLLVGIDSKISEFLLCKNLLFLLIVEFESSQISTIFFTDWNLVIDVEFVWYSILIGLYFLWDVLLSFSIACIWYHLLKFFSLSFLSKVTWWFLNFI